MFVALDSHKDAAVSSVDIDNDLDDKESETAVSTRYRCLLCGSELRINSDSELSLFESFEHVNRPECINDGNVSARHRLAQEVVTKRLYNTVPKPYHPIQINVEDRIPSGADFVISDVAVSEPCQLAVEVVYMSNHISLRRRLQTLFQADYAVMLICLSDGRVAPATVEDHLQKIVSSLRVGRFNPATLDLQLGSLITPERIDPDTSPWTLVPGYLS